MLARHAHALRLLVASLALSASFGVACDSACDASSEPRTLATNRHWEALDAPGGPEDARSTLRQAARELWGWEDIHLAGVRLEAAKLLAISNTPESEPLARALREQLRRPVDLDDFLLLLDDLLVAGRAGLHGELVWITPGRGRKAGVLLHPDDVFFDDRPRRYGEHGDIAIDMPSPQRDLPPAQDGDVLGPNWTMRYRNPSSEKGMLKALAELRGENPGDGGFADRVAALLGQLREQGAVVYLNSTVRRRERGYLMWGAFELGRQPDQPALLDMVERLRNANRDWGLDVPIEWVHPGGWTATREAAREMADTYEVVYATEAGARSSNHYEGLAVDLVAVGLPRTLVLEAPGGERRSFDLSDPEESRDFSLTPELIRWVENSYELQKLESDYPHWDDARAGDRPAAAGSR